MFQSIHLFFFDSYVRVNNHQKNNIVFVLVQTGKKMPLIKVTLTGSYLNVVKGILFVC